ncbi:MAG: hypothetical protein ACRETN_11765 [Nevskiales bacterium]
MRFLLLLIFLAAPAASYACATCLCGDPSITTLGTEKPFKGRMRGSVEYLTRSETVGTSGVSEHEIEEGRVTYSFSYAPSDRWILGVSLPFVRKHLERFDLSEEQADDLGDADLSARWFLGTDERFPARRLWGLQFGLRLPTSAEQKSNGQPIDFDAQPGAGAIIPSAGAWYGYYRLPWLLYGSAIGQIAADEGYQGFEAGNVLLLTGLSQYGLHQKLALQLSLDARLKEKDRFDDGSDPDSGGLLVMVTPGVAWTVITDLIVNVAYQIPAVEDLNGEQEEDGVFRLGVTYDF